MKKNEAIESFNILAREFNNAIEYFKDDKEIVNKLKRNRAAFKKEYFKLITKTADENSKYFALTQI